MQNLNDEVEAALGKIREGLRVDGGDVELVDISDGIVTVRLQGGQRITSVDMENVLKKSSGITLCRIVMLLFTSEKSDLIRH